MLSDKRNNKETIYIQRISALNKTPQEVARIEQLFKENENLAYKIAKKYYRTGYWEFDDSIQIARMGLWKACLIWDPNKFKLSTLATNVITRDFIDYDTKQKRQPNILFNLEENCVTEDLNLGDVLVDENTITDEIIEGKYNTKYINSNIVNILDGISKELNLPRSQTKLIYLVYVESTQYMDISVRNIKFLPKSTISAVIELFRYKLSKLQQEKEEDY